MRLFYFQVHTYTCKYLYPCKKNILRRYAGELLMFEFNEKNFPHIG